MYELKVFGGLYQGGASCVCVCVEMSLCMKIELVEFGGIYEGGASS